MKLLKLISLAVLSMALVGCAQTPRVILKDYDEQDVGLVAKHWRNIARKTATDLIGSELKLKEGSIFIASDQSDSAFNKAFEDYLATALLERGVVVARRAANANAVINFRAETYLYSKKKGERTPFDKKSFWAILYTVFNDFNDMSQGELEFNLISLGLVLDFLEAKNKVTDAEVVLTVSIEDFESVRYKRSTEFYIQRNDLMLYWSDKAPYAAQLTSTGSAGALQTKSLNVVKK